MFSIPRTNSATARGGHTKLQLSATTTKLLFCRTVPIERCIVIFTQGNNCNTRDYRGVCLVRRVPSPCYTWGVTRSCITPDTVCIELYDSVCDLLGRRVSLTRTVDWGEVSIIRPRSPSSCDMPRESPRAPYISCAGSSWLVLVALGKAKPLHRYTTQQASGRHVR